MAWWSSIFGKDEEFTETKDDEKEEVAGLNFKSAMEAHLKWKLRLKSIIDGNSSESLEVKTVARDDQCDLGKWIHSQGSDQFGNNPEFKSVVEAHAQFHRCAGHTLQLALDGKFNEADAELTNGDFSRASLTVSRCLVRLWRNVSH
jgi:hypothetical protein